MFARLPETEARAERSRWGSATSVALHAGVVLLAVYGTSTAKPSKTPPVKLPPVIYTQTPTDPTQHENGGASRGGVEGAPPLPPIHPGGPTIDVGSPPPFDANVAVSGDSTILGDIARGGAPGAGAVGGGGPATELAVDEPVGVVVERTPRYPDGLRAASVEGTVVLRFVVDTTGRAELATVRVVSSTQEQFTSAVLAALRQTRFVPGRIGGRAVPTLVERSYRFALEGRP